LVKIVTVERSYRQVAKVAKKAMWNAKAFSWRFMWILGVLCALAVNLISLNPNPQDGT
jgi:hypothetical protein